MKNIVITSVFANENEMEKPIRYEMYMDDQLIISGDQENHHVMDHIMGFLQALDVLHIEMNIEDAQKVLRINPVTRSPFDIRDRFVTDSDGITRKRKVITRK